MKPISTRLALACLATSCLAVSANALAEPGDMMHMAVDTKVQVGGMAIAVPAVNHDICVSRHRDPREYVNRKAGRGGDCTMSDVKQVGDTYTFHYACTGDMAFQGDGRFSSGGSGLRGEIHASGNVHGQPLAVAINYVGTPTGATCESSSHSAGNDK